MLSSAPLYDAIADAPAGGLTNWLRTSDGVRIRVGSWTHKGAKGTVLLFPGRTEYVEKYGRAAADLRDRGYATVVIDWRGQGLADRLNTTPSQGHVCDFLDYQRDVEAVLDYVRPQDLPKPYYLLGHSMGGCIGLRALINGLDVKAAGFSAPMWGILMSPALRPVAWVASTLATRVGLSNAFAPGQNGISYLKTTTLAENTLTSDPDMFAYMRDQVMAHPELTLGGPSTRWLNQSLIEMRALSRLPSPNVPCVTFLGTDEEIVDPAPIKTRMSRWINGELVVLEKARHEILMETPALRNRAFDVLAAHFDAHP